MSTTRFVSRWFEHLKPTSRKKQMHAAKSKQKKKNLQTWHFNLVGFARKNGTSTCSGFRLELANFLYRTGR
jgi:hypothetical protein